MGGGAGSAMVGVGFDPEGIDNNPAYWQLLIDSAWRSEPLNVSSSLQSWGAHRCGQDSPSAKAAWALLGQTVYASTPAQHYEHHMAYCPTTIIGGSTWDTMHASEKASWYDPATLHKA